MFNLLVLAHVQFMIMLIELQEVLSLGSKCLSSKITTVMSEWTVPKTMDISLLQYYCISNKYIVYKSIILYSNVYILYILVIYPTDPYSMSTSGILIHYIGWGCQSPNPQEMDHLKWEFCVRFARFSGTYPWCKMRPACILTVWLRGKKYPEFKF